MFEYLNLIITISVTIIGLLITGTTTIVVSTWKVSQYIKKHEISVVKAITDHVKADTEEFFKIRTEIDDQGDLIRREVGEGMLALRQVMNDLRLAHEQANSRNLEMYVRKQSFYEVVERMTKEYKDLTKDLATDIKSLTSEIIKLNKNVKPL